MAIDPTLVQRKPSQRKPAWKPARAPARADRRRRQNDLLDEALLETFPASDPVSVYRVT